MCSACPRRCDYNGVAQQLNSCDCQIEEEIHALFDFMQHIYGLFGFEFHLELSTRPDNYLGTIETWNEAERVSVSISISSPGPLGTSQP